MPAFGAYPVADAKDPGDEISSTYEGRHLSLLESEVIHPTHDDGFADHGDPVVFGTVALQGVGVVGGPSAIAATDYLSIDTEGIWNLDVVAENDDGNIAVEGGDPLYINITTAVVSKISNTVTNVPFGYALGHIDSGSTEAIAVKVHWNIKMTGSKGLDHVQGTSANPIAWGTDGSNIKSLYASIGVLTDYISGIRFNMVTTDDVPAGGIQGVLYGRVYVKHSIQDMYGLRGVVTIAPDTPVAEIANMVVGVMGSVSLSNAGFAYTIADSIKGGDFSVSQVATSALTTGSIRAVYADVSGVKVDNSGRTQGVYIKQGGGGTSYPDYGLFCHLESNNLLAAIIIKTFTSCVAPVGIQFTADTGSITALMAFSGTATYLIDLNDASGANATITSDSGTAATTWKARIKVRTDDGTDAWINVYSTSNEA